MTKDITPASSKLVNFEVHRYQLIVNKTIQFALDSKHQTAEEIRAAKNETFQELITNKNFHFKSSKSEITSKLVHTKGDLSVFKLAVKRSLKVSKKDFTEGVVENYPNIIIAINNNPAVQKIAIQQNTKAFAVTHPVSRIIEESVDKRIKNQNLSFYLEPIFDKQEFWNLVTRYDKRITQVTFDLISPNMANISKNLKVDLKQIYEDTNSHKTRLELNSDKDDYLQIDEKSKLISSLVDYSAEGAGNIALRVKGYHKKFHTAQSPTEFSIDEQLLKSSDWDELDRQFNEFLI